MKDIDKIKRDLTNCESKIKNIEATSVKVLQEIFQVVETKKCYTRANETKFMSLL